MNNIYFFSFLYAVFNVTGAAIIKNKLMLLDGITLKEFLIFLIDAKIVIAIFFIFISMFFSIKALSMNDFSSVIPVLTGINFLVTVLVGFLFFNDVLTLSGYVGILFIILGIYLLGA